MVRVGGGFERFIEYIPKNHRFFERTLVVYMIKSGESLEWVVDALKNGKKIITKIQQKDAENKQEESKKRSLSRSPSSRLSRSPTSGRSLGNSGSRTRFSFRDVSPYSKTKTASLNI